MDVVHYHFEKIDSTNTWAKKNANTFDPNKISLITADEQTSGRGRFNRTWVSPPKQNIYATFCFFLNTPRSDIGNIPQVLALSCATTLQELNFKPTLRWPNDILLSNKKVGGILCETTPQDNTLCVLAGIGINVNMPLTYLEEIDRPATSLHAETHQTYDPAEVLQKLENHFVQDILLFIDKGFAPFFKRYTTLMALPKDKTLHFHDNQKEWEGHFHSINEDGSLNLQLPDGEIRTFVAGEFI